MLLSNDSRRSKSLFNDRFRRFLFSLEYTYCTKNSYDSDKHKYPVTKPACDRHNRLMSICNVNSKAIIGVFYILCITRYIGFFNSIPIIDELIVI